MINLPAALARFLLLFVLAAPAAAQLVHIRADDAEGRGMAMLANGRCHVLVPAHVVKTAERIKVTARGRISAEARVVRSFDDGTGASRVDFAILELPVDSKVPCNEPLPDARALTLAIDDVANILVRRLSAEGQVRNSSGLVRDVSATELRFSPGPSSEDALAQGDSGSMLYVDKVPVAMFIARSDVGSAGSFRALRLDMLTGLASTHFAAQRAPTRAFRFARMEVTNQLLAADNGQGARYSAGLAQAVKALERDLRTETDRLLSGTKGFPPVQNDIPVEQAATAGWLTLTLVQVDAGIRNQCTPRRGELLGIPVTTYEAGPGSVCQKGWEQMRQLTRAIFRLTGEVRETSSGNRAPIQMQFGLILPVDPSQMGLPLRDELSAKMCDAVKDAVVLLKQGKGRSPARSSIFASTDVVPQISGGRMRQGC